MENIKTFESFFRKDNKWEKEVKTFMNKLIDDLKSGKANEIDLRTDGNNPSRIFFKVNGKKYKFELGGSGLMDRHRFKVSLWGNVPNINSSNLEDGYISLTSRSMYKKLKKLFFNELYPRVHGTEY